MDVQLLLRDHIVANYMGGDGAGLDGDTSLIGLNIIESAAVFDLVHYLRTEIGVPVPIEDVVPENFESINTIVRLVRRLRTPG